MLHLFFCYSFLLLITFSYKAFISYAFSLSLQSTEDFSPLSLMTTFSLFKTLLIFLHTGPTDSQQGREDPPLEKPVSSAFVYWWRAEELLIDVRLTLTVKSAVKPASQAKKFLGIQTHMKANFMWMWWRENQIMCI